MNRRGFLRSILPAAVAGAAALRGCVLPGNRPLPPPDNTPQRDNVDQGLPVVREADSDTHIPASYVHQLREVLEADPRFEKVSMWEAERPANYVIHHDQETGKIVFQAIGPKSWATASIMVNISTS